MPKAIRGQGPRWELLWARWATVGIAVGAVALVVSLALFFAISLASRPPRLDRDIEAAMDL